ncbi:MAG: glycosyltransferase family 4 protein [Bacteroidaceae bacterium]|nr:glycosyltransferase family 4 protein [Bacteroidaceae bacterium]
MTSDAPIYLVVAAFFPSHTSCRGSYTYDQVRAIERTGRYRVVVLMPTPCYHPESDYTYGGVHVHRFKCYDLPSNVWPGSGDRLTLWAFDNCLRRLSIAFTDIAVVHAHVSCNALYANHVKAKNPNCLSLLQHHGYDVLRLRDGRFADCAWHKRRCITYGKRQCSAIDLHVGVSHEILRYLEAYDGIIIRDKFVLYNGVDSSKFFPAPNRPAGVFHIGCVANFWELKDQMTLIRAVESLVSEGRTNIRVSFVGSGYTRLGCEQYVAEHGLQQFFEFRNEMSHSLLNDYYNSLSLFVLPSYWDSFGCVYTEAYACGVPFMTAQGTGITELIPADDRDKWVIAPHDYMALARNIRRVLDDPRNLPVEQIQPLTSSIDIQSLVNDFLNFIESKG